MGPLRWFLFVYVLGGVTFVPLLLAAVLAYAYYTLPPVDEKTAAAKAKDPAQLLRDEDQDLILRTATDDLAEKFHRKHDSDVAAGYFAVCREWVPGGVNGKPPDKLSPAGETIATESPSVYQSMYRSLFDRSQRPTIEPQKDGAGKSVKRANNIFYVVLRHGHLMLYDDIQQLEVRYVVSLDYHDVDVFAGNNNPIPEGELWVKRHAIRLTRKASKDSTQTTSLPFFLFSENQSEKEDFYHALLKNQERTSSDSPIAEDFDTAYIVKLVQKLHSSEEQLQTRWLNAFIGRLFLATYKTPEFEDFIRSKLTKKIARVQKPTFITRISLLKIDTGTAGPFVTNPRLKDLTVNGDCLAEFDVEYTGGFRIEIGATARIDLGKRFGAREVDMVLACTVKRVQGHLLVRFKPQPSNRIWFAFEKMPQMDLALEPIVSTRKITYSIVLGAIESRIREVVAESLVLPFWDDIPFLDTATQKFRGGIWKREKTDTPVDLEADATDGETEVAEADDGVAGFAAIKAADRNFSMPTLPGNEKVQRKPLDSKSVVSLPVPDVTPSEGDKTPPARPPRTLRAMSFANAADPAVTANNVDSDAIRVEAEAMPKRDSARDVLKDLSARSGSPTEAQNGSPPVESAMAEAMKGRSDSSASKTSVESGKLSARSSAADFKGSPSLPPQTSRPGTPSRSKRFSLQEDQKPIKNLSQSARSLTTADRKQALASATAAAQKWSTLGWGVLARAKQKDGQASDHVPPTTPTSGTPSEPMGRGQPLPPPGQPLPRPPRKQNTIMSNIPFMVPKKPTLPKRPDATEAGESTSTSKPASSKPPPLPDRRRRKSTMHSTDAGSQGEDLLVIEAPAESAPTSPEADRFNNANRDDFFGHGEEDEEDRRSGLDERRYDRPQSGATSSGFVETRSRDDSQEASANVRRPAAPDTKEYSPSLATSSARDGSFSDKENNEVADFETQGSSAPRPPPPARTNSAASDRRSSRIPGPASPVLSSVRRKPRELHRQSSNLSAASASSPALSDREWGNEPAHESDVLQDSDPARNHSAASGAEFNR